MNTYDPQNSEQRIRDLEEQVRQLQNKTGSTPSPTFTIKNKKNFVSSPFFALSIMAIAGIVAYWGFSTGLKGSFSFKGNHYNANSCRSGAAFIPQFWGVVIRSGSKTAPRIEIQGDSPAKAQLLVWGADSETPFLFNQQSCKTLEVKLETNGSKVNEVTALEGFLKAQCVGQNNTEFSADIKFRNCH